MYSMECINGIIFFWPHCGCSIEGFLFTDLYNLKSQEINWSYSKIKKSGKVTKQCHFTIGQSVVDVIYRHEFMPVINCFRLKSKANCFYSIRNKKPKFLPLPHQNALLSSLILSLQIPTWSGLSHRRNNQNNGYKYDLIVTRF